MSDIQEGEKLGWSFAEGGGGRGGAEKKDTSGDVKIQIGKEACCSAPNTQRREEISAAAHAASV